MSDYEQEVAAVVDLIEKATAEDLTGPEWHINLMICDAANGNQAICDDIVRALQRRMQSGSPRVVQQTLVLAETLVKNGSTAIHTQIGSRAFLQEVASVTDGSMGFDVQNKSLELIKQWADAFAGSTLTTFQDTYRMLKIHGVVFPEVENDVPVFTPPPTTSTSASGSASMGRPQHQQKHGSSRSVASTSSTSAAATPREQQIAKLHADLQVVKDKIAIYRDLKERGRFDADAMEDVVDFLQQCQPRMNTLIEGGIMGKLDERTLEECLNANDHLIKVLEDAKSSNSKPAPSPKAAAADLISFDSPQRKAAGSPRQRHDSLDNMASLSLGGGTSDAARPAASSHVSIRSTMNSANDDFDSFLNSRTKH